jgi:hypothetical protein
VAGNNSHWKPEIFMNKSKAYLVDVRCSNELNDAPSVAVFTIDKDEAKEIVRLAEVVKENDLYKVERFDYRVSYLKKDPEDLDEDDDLEEENEARVDCDCISVSSNEFWFSAKAKHTDIEFTTERQPIQALADSFGVKFTA